MGGGNHEQNAAAAWHEGMYHGQAVRRDVRGKMPGSYPRVRAMGYFLVREAYVVGHWSESANPTNKRRFDSGPPQ